MSDVARTLQESYAAVADLWCSPRDVDPGEARKTVERAAASLEPLDGDAAGLLRRFGESRVSEEDYVALFELDPRCPLYLGSHAFDEPMTCAQAAVSDRNGYMIELLGIYRHLGLTPNGAELPDYLPLVVDFLSLTSGSEDPMREKLINEYLLPFLPPIRSRLEGLGAPHVHLLDALERMLKLDVGARTTGVSHAG
jgi:nitrate reductase assembly molybdenum cofactor insertion protein NarJ